MQPMKPYITLFPSMKSYKTIEEKPNTLFTYGYKVIEKITEFSEKEVYIDPSEFETMEDIEQTSHKSVVKESNDIWKSDVSISFDIVETVKMKLVTLKSGRTFYLKNS